MAKKTTKPPKAPDTRTSQQKLLDSARTALDKGNWDSLTQAQKDAIEAEYGAIANLVISDDGLMKLFTNAVKGKWTSEYFKIQAEATGWFKERTSSQEWFGIQLGKALGGKDKILFDKIKQGDKKYINEQIAKSKDLLEIKDTIKQAVQDYVVSVLGLDIADADVISKIDNISTDLISNYYNPSNQSLWQNQIQRKVSAEFKGTSAKDIFGTIATTITEINKFSKSMGMPVGDEYTSKYIDGLLDGSVTSDMIINQLRDSASKMWSQFSDRIKGGETIDNILYPYTQLIGSMLEIDPASIDITAENTSGSVSGQIDPLLQKALFSSSDSKGVMSLTDLRKAIKNDNRWQYTKNAQEEYSGLTRDLMRMFGAGV